MKAKYDIRNRRGGFTLLELVVAAAILAFGVVAVLEAVTRGLSNTRTSYEQTQAVSLADAKLAELRSTSSLRNGSEEGAFSRPFAGRVSSQDFRWRTEVWPSQIQGTGEEGPLLLARVTVFWDTGPRTHEVTIESLLPGGTKATDH